MPKKIDGFAKNPTWCHCDERGNAAISLFRRHGRRECFAFSRLLKKYFTWFDKLTTNGKKSIVSMFPPFALSLSKGKLRVFQQPVRLAMTARNPSLVT